jgi:hypothetical protein
LAIEAPRHGYLFAHPIRPAKRIPVPVKHRRDQDALLLESVQHKIRKAPQERLVCSQGDDLMALGQALETFDDRVKGKKELEPQPPPLALIPPERLFHLAFSLRQE